MKIICISCPPGAPEIEEANYPSHMQTMHPGGQLSSIAANKNVPKSSNLPPELAANLPDADFMKLAQEIDEAEKQKQQNPVPPPTPAPKPQPPTRESPPFTETVAQKKPIELTYKYTGQDDKGHEVVTLETDLEDTHFAIAYCIQCNKQIKAREVDNLKKDQIVEEALEESLKDFMCGCGKTFKNQRALTMHTWRKHKEIHE